MTTGGDVTEGERRTGGARDQAGHRPRRASWEPSREVAGGAAGGVPGKNRGRERVAGARRRARRHAGDRG